MTMRIKTLIIAVAVAISVLGGISEKSAYSADEMNSALIFVAGDNAGAQGQAAAEAADPGTLFYNPTGIAADTKGNIYVADTSRNRIMKIVGGDQGDLIFTSLPLNSPQGVAVVEYEGKTYVFVADTGNNRIVKLEDQGREGMVLVGELTGFQHPRDVAVDAFPRLYVADGGNNRISRYNMDLTPEVFAGAGGNSIGEGVLKNPYGLTVDSDKNVYVADTSNNRVVKFNPQGGVDIVIGGEGRYQGSFESPSDVEVGPDGSIYVADTNNYRIQKFSQSGIYLGTTGTWSKDKGEFFHPQKLALGMAGDKNVLYVVDSTMWRVQGFDVNAVGFVKAAAPELVSPHTNDAIGDGDKPGFTFTWGAVPGAAKYKLKIIAPDGREISDRITVSSLNLDDLFAGLPTGEYKWTVRAEDGNMHPLTEYAQEQPFKKILPAPKNISPANNVMLPGLTPSGAYAHPYLRWNPVIGASSYVVNMWVYRCTTVTCNGFNPIINFVTTNPYVSPLSYAGNIGLPYTTARPDMFIWNVTAFDKYGNPGKNSGGQNFMIYDNRGPLPAPVQLGPSSYVVQREATTVLQWSDIAGAMAYEVTIEGVTDPNYRVSHSFTWPIPYTNAGGAVDVPISKSFIDYGEVKFNSLELIRNDIYESKGFVVPRTKAQLDYCMQTSSEYACLLPWLKFSKAINNSLNVYSAMKTGRYRWKVRAFSDIAMTKPGIESVWYEFEKSARPGPVKNLKAVIADQQVTLNWDSYYEKVDGSMFYNDTSVPMTLQVGVRGPENNYECDSYGTPVCTHVVASISPQASDGNFPTSYTVTSLQNLKVHNFALFGIDSSGAMGGYASINNIVPYAPSSYPNPPLWMSSLGNNLGALRKPMDFYTYWQTVTGANIYKLEVINKDTALPIYTNIVPDAPPENALQSATIPAVTWDALPLPTTLLFRVYPGQATFDSSGNYQNPTFSSQYYEEEKTITGFTPPEIFGPEDCPAGMPSCNVVSSALLDTSFRPAFRTKLGHGRAQLELEACAATAASPFVCDTTWHKTPYSYTAAVNSFSGDTLLKQDAGSLKWIWQTQLDNPPVMRVKVDGYFLDALGQKSDNSSKYGGEKYLIVAEQGSPLLLTAPAASDYITSLTGEAGPSPFVDLKWTTNDEDKITGYRVYRHTEQITEANLNAAKLLTPFWGYGSGVHSYRDNTGEPGATYYYALKAVLSDGQETLVSDNVTATVAQLMYGAVSGRVSMDGAAVAKSLLIARNKKTGQYSYAETDDTGNFTLYLSGGDWDADASGGAEYVSSGPQTVTITTNGQTIAGLAFTLQAKTVRLSGFVSSGPFGLAGAHVVARSSSATSLGTTDPGGAYSLNVGAGVWDVEISKEGYISQKTTLTIAAGETSVENINFTLIAQKAFVAGRVLDENGLPVDNVQIVAAGPSLTEQSVTGADGSYYVKLGMGYWNLKAKKTGYNPSETQSVSVMNNTTYVPNVDFQISTSQAHIRGVVSNMMSGQAMGGVLVSAIGENVYTATTQSNGSYDIIVSPNETNEKWVVTAAVEGYFSEPVFRAAQISENTSTLNNMDFSMTALSLATVVVKGPQDSEPDRVATGDKVTMEAHGAPHQGTLIGRIVREDSMQPVAPEVEIRESSNGSGVYIGETTIDGIGPASIKGVVSTTNAVMNSSNRLYLQGAVPDVTPPLITSFTAAPAIFKGDVDVDILFSEDAMVSVTVEDEAGGIVKELASEYPTTASELLLKWDGTNTGGAGAQSGIYLIRVNYFDRSGNPGTAGIRQVVLDREPPSISNVFPQGGAEIDRQPEVISAIVNDNPQGAGVIQGSVTIALDTETNLLEATYNQSTGVIKTSSPFDLSNGEHKIYISAADALGNSRRYESDFSVAVDSVAPVAVAGPDILISEGGKVTFSAAASYDPQPGSGIAAYYWDLDGDGTFEYSGRTVTKTYLNGANLTATLKVVDQKGNIGFDTVAVTVHNVAPVANAGSDVIVRYGDEVHFSGNFIDAGIEDTHTFEWDFGDLSQIETTKDVTHRFLAKPGTYTVKFKVADDDGSFGEDTLTVIVAKENAIVTYLGQNEGHYHDNVSLSARITTNDGTQGALSGKTVAFSIGGQTVSAVTDASGLASANMLIDQHPGTYPMEIRFDGDDYFFASRLSYSYEIKKEQFALAYTGDVQGEYSDTARLSAVLSDVDGGMSDIGDKTITWTISDKALTSHTDSAGLTGADLKLSLIPGKYQLTAAYAGDDYFEPLNDTQEFTIDRKTMLIVNNTPLTGKYSNVLSISGYLKNPKTVTVEDIGAKAIEVTVGTQHLSLTTDATGRFESNVVLGQEPNSYNFGFNFIGDEYYRPAQFDAAFEIQKEDIEMSSSHVPFDVEIWPQYDGVSVNKTAEVSLIDNDGNSFDPVGIDAPLSLSLSHAPFFITGNPIGISPRESTGGQETVLYNLSFEQSGEYELKLQFVGNKYYNPASISLPYTIRDTVKPLILSFSDAPDYFSPDGNGVKDSVEIDASIQELNSYKAAVTISCAGDDAACRQIYDGLPLKVFSPVQKPAAGSITPQSVSFVWDGRDSNARIVYDGTYNYTVDIIDNAGNETSGTALLTVDNPPRITVQESKTFFSPNYDGVKDDAILHWQADQEGYFTIKVYDSNNNLVADLGSDISNAGHVNENLQVMWNGLDSNGRTLPEGEYSIVISGRDAHSIPENPCVAVRSPVILDITAPQVAAYYPYENEFTSLNPRIKVDISDGLSGFDHDGQLATAQVRFSIQGIAAQLNTNVKANDDTWKNIRAWTEVNNALTQGPNFITVTATDLAGNTGRLNSMRFVSISPLQDDFEGTGPVAQSKWTILPINHDVQGIAPGSATQGSGAIELSHFNRQQSLGKPNDTFGFVMIGNGLYDISRQFAEVEVKGLEEDGAGDAHLAGIIMASYSSDTAVMRVNYLRSGNTVSASINDGSGADQGITTASVSGPADLKIQYDEGVLRFYLNGDVIAERNVSLSNIIFGVGALSGFDLPGGQSQAHAVIQDVKTNLIAPVLNSVNTAVAGRPDDRVTVLNQDSYIITAEGTPWQKDVDGSIYNPFRVQEVGNVDVALDRLSIGGRHVLVEDPEGSGKYTSGPIISDTYHDADGNETFAAFPFAANKSFTAHPFYPFNFAMSSDSYLVFFTDAVSSVSLTNSDNPPGYAYIAQGEKYHIEAPTRPGDWKIQAYLLNADALSPDTGDSGPFQYFGNAVIAGPVQLSSSNDGTKYYADGVLDNVTDASGTVAANIIARVVYGPLGIEAKPSNNSLRIGEPLVRYAFISNNDRPQQSEIMPGETVSLSVRAKQNQTLEAFIVNTNNPSAPEGSSMLGDKFTLQEEAGGMYHANVFLSGNFDKGYNIANHIKAAVRPVTKISEQVLSNNELALHPHCQASGEPFPSTITQYQEPLFNYKVENVLNANLSGTIEGVITHIDNNGDMTVPYSSFADQIDMLSTKLEIMKTATFTPVGAPTGTHPILLFFRPYGTNIRELLMNTTIDVNVCK